MLNIFGDGVRVYHASAQLPLGTVGCDAFGSFWRYVKFLDAITYVSGHVCGWSNTDAWHVTNDESGSTDRPAGVLVPWKRADTAVVPTQNQFGWIQFRGLHLAVAKAAASDSWTDGLGGIMHSSADGVAAKEGTTPAATADIARWLGFAAGASEDTAAGTWREDTVPILLNIA